MNTNVKKRLELLEIIAHEKKQKRAEAAKALYATLIGNTAYINNCRIVADTPLDAVATLEGYIKKHKPESVTIGVELSGICDLIPGLPETDMGRELDTWFVVCGGMSGDYFWLIDAGIPLPQIILCEMLIPYLRESGVDSEIGIELSFTDSALSIAHDMELILLMLLHRVEKYKESGTMTPRNKWSRYYD